MAVKASVTITISKYRDTDSITRYYKLQASTAAAPAVPTTLTPSGWSTSEPTYTSGSTNTLYYTDCVIFSDGTFQYTDDGNGKAVKSSSYEAAKEAYNKAQAAQNTANTAQENLDNLEIGGRNIIRRSREFDSKNVSSEETGRLTDASGKATFGAYKTFVTRKIVNSVASDIMAQYRILNVELNEQYAVSFYARGTGMARVYFYGPSNYIQIKSTTAMTNANGKIEVHENAAADGNVNITLSNDWKRYWIIYTLKGTYTNNTEVHEKDLLFRCDNKPTEWEICGIKLEKGNKVTDWSPAPEDMNDTIVSVTNLYYASDSSTLPAKPTTHVTTNNTTTRNAWNIGLPTYDEQYPYLYTCKEVLNKGGTYSWTTVNQTTYAEAIKTMQTELNAVQADYLKETTFTTYKREQIENDQGIKQRLSRTEVTVYGDLNNPDDPEALINHIQKVDNDINGSGGLDDRLEAAEDTIDGTGLNDYDQRVKITQRFLNVETDVESIKNIFNITGGTNLVQNSVGYFADNDNKPTMWSISANTIYIPFGYDGDLTGITVSRARLFCAKGSVTTAPNNIVALLANKMMSISFKYKNGANATSKIKVFNGSVVYFEKTFNSAVNQWTEYTFNPDTDPVLANPSFLNTANSLQISIESTNSTNNNGFEISDLILNYGDIKPWELSSNEVYGTMVKLSSLGIEVTATTAKTKNFMTTDGILVYQYDPQTDTIGNLITKITDNGTITNRLESTGDIVERDLIHTTIRDSSNNNVYVEYIR